MARCGPGAFVEIPGQKTEKRYFPVLKALLGGKSGRPKSFSPKLRNFFYVFRFGRPDPQGQEIAKYWFFRPFWPRTALGTERNSGRKTEKHNFPVLEALLGGGSSRPKSFSPKLRIFFTFSFWPLGQPDPQGREITKCEIAKSLGHFGPRQPLALREIPGQKRKSTTSRVQLVGYQKDGNTHPSARS